MVELLRMVRTIGLGQAWALVRAYRLGWKGMISGYISTRVIQTLLNVGFFDDLSAQGSIRVEEYAAEHDLDPQVLQALVDCLYTLGILDKNGAGYRLDEKGKILTGMARGWFEGVYAYAEVYHSLEALLKKEKVYGRDLYRRPDYIARGSGEMEKLLYFPLALEIITQNRYKRVLDLGCGEATFLRYLCENTDAIGYGVDLAPEAIEAGRMHVRKAGLQDRIWLQVGDIRQIEEWPSEWYDVDVATAFMLLHEILYQGREVVVNLLQNYRRHFTGVPLLVFEVIRPTPEEMRRRPGMAAHYFLQHDLTHQKLVDDREWREIFRDAGFASVEERFSRFARSAIFILR